MSDLYLPRPERWPQFSLRGLLIITALAAISLPWTVDEYRASQRHVQRTKFYPLDGPLSPLPGHTADLDLPWWLGAPQ